MNLGPWLLLPPYEFSVYYCLPLSGFPGHKELQFTLHRPESPDQHSQVREKRERGGTEVKRERERERRERGGVGVCRLRTRTPITEENKVQFGCQISLVYYQLSFSQWQWLAAWTVLSQLPRGIPKHWRKTVSLSLSMIILMFSFPKQVAHVIN